MNRISRLLAVVVASVLVTTALLPAQAATAATTTASAVRSVKVTDAWSSSTPRTARAKITWTKPASTYGYKIVGYRIEKSFNKSTWTTVVANTNSTATSRVITSGLKVGVNNYFRVRAITKKGSVQKIGTASAVVSKPLTATPKKPILLGLTKLTPTQDTYTAYWVPQSGAQAGAIDPRYTVKANAVGFDTVQCTTGANKCQLTGLTPNLTYKLQLTVNSTRGQAVNDDEYVPTDADYAKQWYLGETGGISAARAWTATKGSANIVVAVLDSGITAHPDLKGQLVAGYDFVSDQTSSGDGNGIDDDPTDPGDWDQACYDIDQNNQNCWSSWHGTHVAGIIAAKQDSTGITGVAPGVKIQPVRVLAKAGSGSANDLAIAIMWAAGSPASQITELLGVTGIDDLPTNKTPAKVINMSMAGRGYCPGVVQVAIEAAEARGATLVSAAGNGDSSNNPASNSLYYPTNCLGPISVGATGYSGDATFYSNYGVDISAPGGDQNVPADSSVTDSGMIYSTSNTGKTKSGATDYKFEMGTSMAAPVVSGILALMYSLRPNVDRDIIWQALQSSAIPFATGTVCAASPGRCGVGIVNAATALSALIALTG